MPLGQALTSPAVTIRPLTAADGRLVEHGFELLSVRSRYLRYGSPLQAPGSTLDWVALLADGRHVAVGACGIETNEPIGVARYVVGDDAVEVAVTVVDRWQGKGVGMRLLENLLLHAKRRGVAALKATVMLENKRGLRLADRAGGARRAYLGGGAVELEIPVRG